MICPKCERKWPEPCEQTACITLYGECIACRFIPIASQEIPVGSASGTNEEMYELQELAKSWKLALEPTQTPVQQIDYEKAYLQLREVAKNVIERWDSPLWKDALPTGNYIYAMRDVIKQYGD